MILAFTNCVQPWVAKGRRDGSGNWVNEETGERFRYGSMPTHWMPDYTALPLPPQEAKREG